MPPIIVDAHLDLAWNALTFGRDYSRPALVTRQLEHGTETPQHNGQTLVGQADLLLGRVAVICGTKLARLLSFIDKDPGVRPRQCASRWIRAFLLCN